MKFKHFLPALGWLLVITGLSVMPGVQLPRFDLFSTDKLIHAAVYAILTGLILSATPAKNTWWAPVFAATYGAFMEYIQYAFVPGRFCEFDDMLANAAGSLFAWVVMYWWQSRKA